MIFCLFQVLRERLGVQCLLGLTATATMATANSVAEHLGIAGDADAIVRGSSVPNNLMLSVSRDPDRERVKISFPKSVFDSSTQPFSSSMDYR